MKIPEIRICPGTILLRMIADGRCGNCAAILSSSYPQKTRSMGDVPHIFRQYDDLDREVAHRSFSREDAEAYSEFIRNLPEVDYLYCCCDAGESRSPAIAAAILRYYGQDDEYIWKNPRFHPNMLVFQRMTESLGIPVPDEEMDRLIYISDKAFANEIRRVRGEI